MKWTAHFHTSAQPLQQSVTISPLRSLIDNKMTQMQSDNGERAHCSLDGPRLPSNCIGRDIAAYAVGRGEGRNTCSLSKGGFSKGDNDVRPDKPCCNWVLMKVAWRGRPDVWSVSRGKAAVAQAASVASVLEDFVIYYVWRIRLLMLPFHQRDIGCSIALTVRFHTCLHI